MTDLKSLKPSLGDFGATEEARAFLRACDLVEQERDAALAELRRMTQRTLNLQAAIKRQRAQTQTLVEAGILAGIQHAEKMKR